MNAFTKISEKGQVVIPKGVRDRLHLETGDRLEVVERPDGVLLRKAAPRKTEPFDVVTARIRARVPAGLPSLTLDEMDDAIADMWAAGGPRWDQ